LLALLFGFIARGDEAEQQCQEHSHTTCGRGESDPGPTHRVTIKDIQGDRKGDGADYRAETTDVDAERRSQSRLSTFERRCLQEDCDSAAGEGSQEVGGRRKSDMLSGYRPGQIRHVPLSSSVMIAFGISYFPRRLARSAR